MLSWSSGLGRHPLTVEIAGSTPAGSDYFGFVYNWILELGQNYLLFLFVLYGSNSVIPEKDLCS